MSKFKLLKKNLIKVLKWFGGEDFGAYPLSFGFKP
jgi:hypothetical protein